MCFVLLLVGIYTSNIYAYDSVPSNALKYKRDFIRLARSSGFGLNANIATYAGQIHNESMWNPDATSWAGAQGLPQGMPATTKWFAKVKKYRTYAPYSPLWSLRFYFDYMYWLYEREDGIDDCNRMAFTLSAYNGGQGWVDRDKKKAKLDGKNELDYWNGVQYYNAGRAVSSIKENREYPYKIIVRFAPLYEKAGWGTNVCKDIDSLEVYDGYIIKYKPLKIMK